METWSGGRVMGRTSVSRAIFFPFWVKLLVSQPPSWADLSSLFGEFRTNTEGGYV